MKEANKAFFEENTKRDLERRLSRGGIAYFSEFSTPQSFLLLCL
jgi:hypothetical protein